MADEIKISNEDVNRYAHFIAGHPDAEVDARHLAATRAVLDALAQDGRLLPPGGEVGEEWSARWTPNAEMAAKGYEVEQAPAGSRERAESLARRYGNDEDGTVELLRRRKYVGPWSPVVSDNSEVPSV